MKKFFILFLALSFSNFIFCQDKEEKLKEEIFKKLPLDFEDHFKQD